MKKFWNLMKTSKNNSAELQIYGPVSEYSWWGDEVTPKAFRDELNALGDVEEIVVRLNSAGGDVFAGLHIYQLLKEHKAKVTVRVEGLAASIASIIACAGDTIIMPKGSMMMIHNPWTSVWGAEANDLRHTADVLDKIRDALVEVYAEKTGMEADEIKALMDAETWLTATDAVEKGFATEMEQEIQIAASMRGKKAIFNGIAFDFTPFTNAPELPPSTTESRGALAAVAGVLALPKPSEGDPAVDSHSTVNALSKEAYEAAVQKGIEQERARMKALDELATTPTAAKLVAEAKYVSGATAEQVAVEILKADNKIRATFASKMRADADSSGVNLIPPSDTTMANGDEKQQKANALAGVMNRIRGGRQS
ncbi:head maturation protease, ClpP-related [Brevibacillus borstelensis]|uniref:head maturation protease, ClpP-related n=1 Tax=Brevibacillus borstelensis TaxID=45462 RepID=UPI00046A72DD|nr:head maturation protease, ClpP-related [Brevibacillus borstelensis]